MYTEGVSYFVIDHDYAGSNKQKYNKVFMIDTLYANDMIIHYDWKSGLCYAEDSVTHDMTATVKLSDEVVDILIADAAVHKWMYRKGETI